MQISSLFKVDPLNGFTGISIAIFSLLVLLYSVRFRQGERGNLRYYLWLILTAAASVGAVLANNLLILLILWGFLAMTLYLLINMGHKAGAIAKKTFIIVGGTDALMLLGVGLIYYLTGTFQMDQIRIAVTPGTSPLPLLAYLCIAFACFAKAGAMPFHSWIPECAEAAPVPVVAYLPASLDKLLGIYLLARISLDMFMINQGLNIFLMAAGSITIIAAVMMALVQHNMKKLLGYHAVSQVGYMVLGLGTGNPVGIAGGIFHMLNNAIYKSCLFLTAGNVEKAAGTTELDKLGGLAKTMPFTYISCIIASLSISGVPPFNGFVSKWMVYQGLISDLQAATSRWQVAAYIIFLVSAMFGSALTLASFMKLIHATYLGQASQAKLRETREVNWGMWLPCIILAAVCVLFGVFAYQIPLKYFILPAVGGVSFLGDWYAGLSTMLIAVGLLIGLLFFVIKGLRPVTRTSAPFVGGEHVDLGATRMTGTEFYNAIKDYGILRKVYKKAEEGYFDIYEQGKAAVFAIGKFLQFLHNGVLPTYLVWTLLGMLGLFFVLMR